MKKPFLSTAFSEDGKKLKNRFEKILNFGKKRTGAIIIAALGAVIIFSAAAITINTANVGIIGGADGPTAVFVGKSTDIHTDMLSLVTDTLDKAISLALLTEDEYFPAEVAAEGHIILETDERAGKVYLLTSHGEYGFCNGNITKVSGTGACAAVAHYTYTPDNGIYNVTKIDRPRDGSLNEGDIKALFPKHLHKRVLSNNYEKDYKTLLAQEHVYVKNYLNDIGRDAKITEHESGPLITDLGASLDVSSKLDKTIKTRENFYKYPYWVGTREYIEDGVRMVYEMSFHQGDPEIIFKKTRFDNGEILELYKVDVQTGEILEHIIKTTK